MAEGSCLLSSCGGNSTLGSNPSLSARIFAWQKFRAFEQWNNRALEKIEKKCENAV